MVTELMMQSSRGRSAWSVSLPAIASTASIPEVTVPNTVSFRQRFTEDEVYVCYTVPYTFSDMQTWLGTVQSCVPNLAEVGILIFGCSIAYLCFAILKSLLVRQSTS